MCWTEKFCFVFRLDLGCLLIGLISLALSSTMTVTSVVFLTMEGKDHLQSHHTMLHALSLVHLDLNHSSLVVIFGIILFISMLWMIFSLALLLGVKLNSSGYVLSYFAFATFLSFFAFLCSLLLLLQGEWKIAFGLCAGLMIHVHFLVTVYTFYQLQIRGKTSFTQTADDDQILIEA